MKTSKTIFIILAVLFTLGMIYAAFNMGSQTTPPWERKKEILEKYKVK
jgi:hypothetical protein